MQEYACSGWCIYVKAAACIYDTPYYYITHAEVLYAYICICACSLSMYLHGDVLPEVHAYVGKCKYLYTYAFV